MYMAEESVTISRTVTPPNAVMSRAASSSQRAADRVRRVAGHTHGEQHPFIEAACFAFTDLRGYAVKIQAAPRQDEQRQAES
jgi:hypothetical protein